MPEYLVHIGPHKTGTTYLQGGLRLLHGALAENGVVFPLEWAVSPSNPSLLKLVEQLRAPHGRADLEPSFAALNAGPHRAVVLSAEGFSNMGPDDIAVLRELIGNNPVRIVFYCRRWCELLPSAWRETIKHGRTYSFADVVADQSRRPRASATVNFGMVLRRWVNAFGLDRVHLVSYSALVDAKEDLLRHFLETFLGLGRLMDGADLTSVQRNASVSLEDTEILRALNELAGQRPGGTAGEVRRMFLRYREQISLDVTMAAIERHRYSIRLDDNAAPLALLHRDLYKTYGQRLVAPKPSHGLFAPAAKDVPAVNAAFRDEPGVRAELAAAHAQVIRFAHTWQTARRPGGERTPIRGATVPPFASAGRKAPDSSSSRPAFPAANGAGGPST